MRLIKFAFCACRKALPQLTLNGELSSHASAARASLRATPKYAAPPVQANWTSRTLGEQLAFLRASDTIRRGKVHTNVMVTSLVTMLGLTRSWCGPAASVSSYQPSVLAGRTARRWTTHDRSFTQSAVRFRPWCPADETSIPAARERKRCSLLLTCGVQSGISLEPPAANYMQKHYSALNPILCSTPRCFSQSARRSAVNCSGVPCRGSAPCASIFSTMSGI